MKKGKRRKEMITRKRKGRKKNVKEWRKGEAMQLTLASLTPGQNEQWPQSVQQEQV